MTEDAVFVPISDIQIIVNALDQLDHENTLSDDERRIKRQMEKVLEDEA